MFRRFALWVLAVFVTLGSTASAQTFIRDAEIEATLQRIAAPVLAAAGRGPKSVRFLVVDDREINAYVPAPNTIVVHAGLLSRLKTVEMIQAVIAHELGHITAGHLITRQIGVRNSQSVAAIGMVIAGIAASRGSNSGALAIAAGGAEVAKRSFLAHSRAEEAAADQASVRYLAKAGISPKAALDTLELVRGQEVLKPSRRDAYARTHPLTSQRIALLRDAASNMRVADIRRDPSLDYWHMRMAAKFDGFTQNPASILRQVAANDRSEIAYYRRAIANHRMSNMDEAHRLVSALIKARPDDPYYRELKAQFYLEAGRAKEAVAHYRAALARAPKSALIKAELARALLQFKGAAETKEALKLLQSAAQADRASPLVLQLQALAYARTGDNGRAALATAERYALTGRLQDAGINAKRATGLLAEGSPAWKNAMDIVRLAERAGSGKE